MRLFTSALLVAGTLAATALPLAPTGASAEGAQDGAPSGAASPLYGVTIPEGYRAWQLVAPAQEAAPLDELRAIVGNTTAIKAYQAGTLPFPDGTVLVKLAWKHTQSPEFATASVPGASTTVQIMVKDSKRYAATGGWGFGRFVNGKPADQAQHETCWGCHQALVADRDYVFTRYAP
ncbi:MULTISPECIES: cytochrome P460 family protein [Nitrospirillum]|uniref:Cytochrome P460 n=1 Tax=Nitrospirillum amazonense TaxID=28077 RepID=A0A560FNA7_9PROT|nr:cytochrome P460 family protein [Nitrospirillum amazonense]MEC4592099.1 cytochrome P460 family protein [Nitrospirillum amazonense]TWB23096.1 cytochrome P460 [Nitrospirillum amazonense]